jgi:serine/threonine protein kinase
LENTMTHTSLSNNYSLHYSSCISGESGVVYKAHLSQGFQQPFNRTVAVKTLKGDKIQPTQLLHQESVFVVGFLAKSRVKDFLDECIKMSTLDHPNVLTLIGVCMDGGPAPYIIMPFMFNGSLLTHLKKERENLVLPPEQVVDSNTVSMSCWSKTLAVRMIVPEFPPHNALAGVLQTTFTARMRSAYL